MSLHNYFTDIYSDSLLSLHTKLSPINFIKSKFKEQIENDLFNYFHIKIKLDTYENMKSNFCKNSINNYFIITDKYLELL